jgi:hypothetical protein
VFIFPPPSRPPMRFRHVGLSEKEIDQAIKEADASVWHMLKMMFFCFLLAIFFVATLVGFILEFTH